MFCQELYIRAPDVVPSLKETISNLTTVFRIKIRFIFSYNWNLMK
jgi:hypothetical protein